MMKKVQNECNIIKSQYGGIKRLSGKKLYLYEKGFDVNYATNVAIDKEGRYTVKLYSLTEKQFLKLANKFIPKAQKFTKTPECAQSGFNQELS